MSRWVTARRACHDELNQAPRSDVRGMPLALLLLPAEDIQLAGELGRTR